VMWIELLTVLTIICIGSVLAAITPRTIPPNISLTFAVQQMEILLRFSTFARRHDKGPGPNRAAVVHFRCFSQYRLRRLHLEDEADEAYEEVEGDRRSNGVEDDDGLKVDIVSALIVRRRPKDSRPSARYCLHPTRFVCSIHPESPITSITISRYCKGMF
jgi:hypothetical protein